MTLEACADCGLVLQNPQPSDAELVEIYGPDYFIGSNEGDPLAQQFDRVKRATARLQLDEIQSYVQASGAAVRLLEIGCGFGNFLLEAQMRGYNVQGVEFSVVAAGIANKRLGGVVQTGSLEDAALPENSFDICVVADVIEHVREPARFLLHVRRCLKERGALFIATPSLDSWSAKLLGSHWMEYKREHLFYFNRVTLQKMLSEAGFANIRITSGKKVLTAAYIIGHFEMFPVAVITPIARGLRRLLPRRLLERELSLTASGVNVMATKR